MKDRYVPPKIKKFSFKTFLGALIILIFLCFVAVFAQEKKDKKKIFAKLLWEADLTEPAEEISIPEKSIKFMKSGKMPHRVVKSSKDVTFVDGKGSVVKKLERRKGHRFYVSEGGDYILETGSEVKLQKDRITINYKLFDNDGNVIYEKENVQPQLALISDATGYIAVVDWTDSGYTRRIFFYDSTGNEVGKYETVSRFGVSGGAWSPDGDHVVFLTGGRQKVNIISFSKSAAILWNYEIKGDLGIGPGGDVNFSNKGNFILLNYGDWTRTYILLFAKQGSLVRKFEFPLVIGKMSPEAFINEKYVAIAHLNTFFIYDIEKNRAEKEVSLPSNFEIHSISVSPSGKLIAVSGITDPNNRVNSEVFVSLYDKEGNNLFMSKMAGQSKGYEFLGSVAKVFFLSDEKGIILSGVKKIRYFTLELEN